MRRLLPAAIAAPVTLGFLAYAGWKAGAYGPTVALLLFGLAMVAFAVWLIISIARMAERAEEERLRLESENAEAAPALAERALELERANAELAEATERLERSNEELQRFATVASHDLREPLRVISGFAEMLARRYSDQLEGDGARFIDAITGGVKRMDEMVADLLAYARAGRADQPVEPVDMDAVVANVLTDLQHAIDDAGAQIEVGELPTVSGNPSALGQLVQNLVSNAIKFAGDEPPRVRIWAAEVPGGWRFSIRDNGIGISPEHAERIFEMFARLHSADRYPGTGVGLALCHRIAAVHGGRIWVEPAAGGGSQFMFTIAQPSA